MAEFVRLAAETTPATQALFTPKLHLQHKPCSHQNYTRTTSPVHTKTTPAPQAVFTPDHAKNIRTSSSATQYLNNLTICLQEPT